MTTTEAPAPTEVPKVEAQVPEVVKPQEEPKTPAADLNGEDGKKQDAPAPAEEKKLSNAEMKAKQKAEKAAKRAAAKGQQMAAEVAPTAHSTPASKAEAGKGGKPQQKKQGHAPAAESKGLPVRGGPQKAVAPVVPDVPKKEDKSVEFFRHLYKPRTFTLAGVNKDVHPAVLALGLQMSNYTICGSCARLVATLQAFKRVCILCLL